MDESKRITTPLRAKRLALGWTVFDTAYFLNISRRTIMRWEGVSPKHKPPEAILDALDYALEHGYDSDELNWRGHGVDPKKWRPVTVNGISGPDVKKDLNIE